MLHFPQYLHHTDKHRIKYGVHIDTSIVVSTKHYRVPILLIYQICIEFETLLDDFKLQRFIVLLLARLQQVKFKNISKKPK